MRLPIAFVSSTLVLLSALRVSAHIGPGFAMPESRDVVHHHLRSRGTNGRLMLRAAPSSESQESSEQDPSQECKPYGLKSSSALGKVYPKAGQIADIVSGDDTGATLFKEILDSGIIPGNVQVKKGTQGNMGIDQGQSDSYDDSDPDCWWTATGCTSPKHKQLSHDLDSCPEPNTWGLSFDDGPNCSHNAFYDFLQKEKLRATLFYIGTNVIDWPLQAQRGLTDGHDICVHTWSHHYTTTLSTSQVFSELYYTMRIIKDVIGVTPRCWRPPYGDVDDRVRAIATALGLRTIVWDHDTDDWNIVPGGKQSTAKIESNYQKIIDAGKNGSTADKGIMVLTHELTNQTMDMFMNEYSKVKAAYKNLVPISACMNASSPYVEDQPTYSNFADFTSGKVDAQGLPQPDAIKINVNSKLNITSEKDQKSAGGFSSASAKKSKTQGDSSSSSPDSQASAAPNSNKSSDKEDGNSASFTPIHVLSISMTAALVSFASWAL
ncbi:hypothetical protein MVES1_003767 [Malassezia vespertilionis]|uniref:chitin deacetylase n=1 Tax=Malassezia vespertilionis TaxID=2020962 RepID=A0A2N1J8L9_9BASI|nr:uncharacterized protein MVES1_003767 [Malassezia vespertilionis]PKI82903.1 hypothetical protein MVES_003326 [Malassezia vespertilionis]WFD08395.1 hypothetical protein MVES1_003767 [Malassezia vespertilionis]